MCSKFVKLVGFGTGVVESVASSRQKCSNAFRDQTLRGQLLLCSSLWSLEKIRDGGFCHLAHGISGKGVDDQEPRWNF
jgi:hypothetical protein